MEAKTSEGWTVSEQSVQQGNQAEGRGAGGPGPGSESAVRRVVVIGAGPRGTSAVERLVSRAAASGGVPASGLRIEVVDSHEPGPGHVWNTEQNRLFLMNTPCFYPTVTPERPAGSGAPGLSFEQFRRLMGDGAVLSETERAELGAMSRTSYPPRALYGAYLRHVWARVAALAESTPGVDGPHHVRATAVAIDPDPAGGYRVVLADGEVLAAHDVVLAVGHVPARLTPAQEAAGRAAAGFKASYLPPHVPADVDHEAFPAGENVLVRGLGLNFFDLMIVLSEGRGGEFRDTGLPAGRALEYVPSGREPLVIAGSRRGAPYRAKSAVDSFVPRGVTLRHLVYERVARAARQGATGRTPGTVDFERHVWPLLQRDVVEHYYATLADQAPELFPSGAEPFLEDLAQILDAPNDIGDEVWTVRTKDLLRSAAPEAAFFNIRALAKPFSGVGHTTPEGHAAAILEWLEADAAGAALGEGSAEHQGIGALHAGRLVTKRLAAEGLIDELSVATQVRGWFEPLVEGLASGPPLERTEQLAALVRAGVVRILGPEPTYTFDDAEGLFSAASPWVSAPPVTSRWMVEAMMPANRVAVTASPLLRDVLESGLGRPRRRTNEDGETVPGSGLDVVGADHRLVGEDGYVADNVHVLGLQLSSIQWGTAIAAEAGAGSDDGARTLGDADAVAATILLRAGVPLRQVALGWVLP